MNIFFGSMAYHTYVSSIHMLCDRHYDVYYGIAKVAYIAITFDLINGSIT